jgi:hypothetical protein
MWPLPGRSVLQYVAGEGGGFIELDNSRQSQHSSVYSDREPISLPRMVGCAGITNQGVEMSHEPGSSDRTGMAARMGP